MANNKKHHGKNIKRLREIMGIKQEALAIDMGDDWNQKKISRHIFHPAGPLTDTSGKPLTETDVKQLYYGNSGTFLIDVMVIEANAEVLVELNI